MTIQDSPYRALPTAPLRGVARAFPVPSDHAAFRRYRADYCRKAALRAGRTARPSAPPAEPAESRLTRGLRRVDHAALGLMSASVLALLPLAVGVLNGLT